MLGNGVNCESLADKENEDGEGIEDIEDEEKHVDIGSCLFF